MTDARLRALLEDVPAAEDVPLAAHTTMGVGGAARIALFPRTEGQLCRVLRVLQEEGVPFALLGRGSNVLVSDKGVRVAVFTAEVNGLSRTPRGVRAGCGASLSALLRFALGQGLGGNAYLAGIPASVGGAVFMNAGARGRYIGPHVLQAEVWQGGKACVWDNERCRFAYKHTAFMESGAAVLAAEIAFFPADPAEERAHIAAALAARGGLPKGRSMGCVFRNPPEGPAGAFIEAAGLKGARCGGASVSVRHANFILNEGGATAEDVRTLIGRVQGEVLRRTGIALQEEIRYIGEF